MIRARKMINALVVLKVEVRKYIIASQQGAMYMEYYKIME